VFIGIRSLNKISFPSAFISIFWWYVVKLVQKRTVVFFLILMRATRRYPVRFYYLVSAKRPSERWGKKYIHTYTERVPHQSIIQCLNAFFTLNARKRTLCWNSRSTSTNMFQIPFSVNRTFIQIVYFTSQ